MSWTEFARQVRVLATWMRSARHCARRSRGRVSAKHPRSDDRDVRDREHRRRLVELRTRLRHARRARPLHAAADPSSFSAWTATATGESSLIGPRRHPRRSSASCRRCDTLSYLPYLDPGDLTPLTGARDFLGGCAGGRRSRTRSIPVRTGAVRASVVDPVFRRARRDFRRPLFIATGVSPSGRNSSCSISTWTCMRGSAWGASPAPAG